MKSACIVAGLGFGDEGKGLMTDFLTRATRASLTVRFNGGCQAAHNVLSPEGVHHTFSQVGSGALAGAATFLSRFMLVEPLALAQEMGVLAASGYPVQDRISADPGCVVITPMHRLANRLREISRGADRHGSVGLGVGEARGDELSGLALRLGDIGRAGALSLLERVQEVKLGEFAGLGSTPEYQELARLSCSALLARLQEAMDALPLALWREVAQKHNGAVFEGAQGVLLDEHFGFAPYNTWTNCTFGNAVRLLDEVGCYDCQKIGVIRSYHTRHGAGPFVTEDPHLSAPEVHNTLHPWMGRFRIGHLDLVALRYAARAARPDCIAVTHMDKRPSELACVAYGPEGFRCPPLTAEFLQSPDLEPRWARVKDLEAAIGIATGIPVDFTSWGPTAEDVKWKRTSSSLVESCGSTVAKVA